MLTRPMATAAALLVATPTAVHNLQPDLVRPVSAQAPQARSAHQPVSAAVRGWSARLDRRAATPNGQKVRGRWSFETIGVTWRRGDDPLVEVRTRANGTWSTWQEADPIGGGTVTATEPVWVDTAQAVQVRVAQWRPGLEVVMVDPGERPLQDAGIRPSTVERLPAKPASAGWSESTARARSAALVPVAAARSGPAPQPRLRKRADWGANERLRDGKPYYLKGIKQAHVHHTAGSSDYTRADVPGIIRSMYWYHTQRLGWSDIGYNFLVDRFGRIWVGRAGGPHQAVRGAHTLGFNHASFGVASIGNHEKYGASHQLRSALVRLIAWKLDKYGKRPAGWVRIISHGSDRYPSGTRVRLRVIDGHRDTNYTACPGRRLYKWLPSIRKRSQVRVDNWN